MGEKSNPQGDGGGQKMKEYVFGVTYKSPVHREADRTATVDAILDGKKPIKKEIIAIKASRMWTALQRLGYKMYYGAYRDDCFHAIRLVSVHEIPKEKCEHCRKKTTQIYDVLTAKGNVRLCRRCSLNERLNWRRFPYESL